MVGWPAPFKVWCLELRTVHLPSGELTVCHGKIHHFLAGKIHYFDWAIFHCYSSPEGIRHPQENSHHGPCPCSFLRSFWFCKLLLATWGCHWRFPHVHGSCNSSWVAACPEMEKQLCERNTLIVSVVISMISGICMCKSCLLSTPIWEDESLIDHHLFLECVVQPKSRQGGRRPPFLAGGSVTQPFIFKFASPRSALWLDPPQHLSAGTGAGTLLGEAGIPRH